MRHAEQQEFRGHTVTIEAVFAATFLVAAPTIFAVEYFFVAPARRLRHARRLLSAARLATGALNAASVTLVFVEAGKNYVGYPRPYFARACAGPERFARLAGEALTPAGGAARCARDSFEQARSFPSGHAALAVCVACYMQLCLMRASRGRSIAALTGYVPFALALFVAASRVVDNAHHPADIVAGTVLGVWPAIVHFGYVERAIEETERKERERNEGGLGENNGKLRRQVD